MKSAESYETYAEIKERLDYIVEQVSCDDIPLDQALSLYEEAVKLGVRVSALIEEAQGEEVELVAQTAADTLQETSENAENNNDLKNDISVEAGKAADVASVNNASMDTAKE